MILTAHPIVNTSRLTWSKQHRMFIGESSDIGPFTRVYDDACDVGLTLQSQYPGRDPIVFVVDYTHRGEDGVLFWDLRPATFREVGFRVRIYND